MDLESEQDRSRRSLREPDKTKRYAHRMSTKLTLRSQFSFTKMLLGFFGLRRAVRDWRRPYKMYTYQVTMHNTGRMNKFEPSLSDCHKSEGHLKKRSPDTHKDLVQEILDKLLL